MELLFEQESYKNPIFFYRSIKINPDRKLTHVLERHW